MDLNFSAQEHKSEFIKAIENTEFATPEGSCGLQDWLNRTVHKLLDLRDRGGKIFFLGNGASSSMSSHFATDFTKNGNFQAFSLTDGALNTCFSNDYSYADAYREMFKRYLKPGDAMVGISSSGNSPNVTNAAEYVKETSPGNIFAFTGFKPENKLRSLGDYGVYVPNGSYGFVETAHSYYMHMLIDTICELGS